MQVLFIDGEQRLSGERWTEAIEEIASFSSRERPEEVNPSYNRLSFEMFKIQVDFASSVAKISSSVTPLKPCLDRHDAFKMHLEVLCSIKMRYVQFFLCAGGKHVHAALASFGAASRLPACSCRFSSFWTGPVLVFPVYKYAKSSRSLRISFNMSTQRPVCRPSQACAVSETQANLLLMSNSFFHAQIIMWH